MLCKKKGIKPFVFGLAHFCCNHERTASDVAVSDANESTCDSFRGSKTEALRNPQLRSQNSPKEALLCIFDPFVGVFPSFLTASFP